MCLFLLCSTKEDESEIERTEGAHRGALLLLNRIPCKEEDWSSKSMFCLAQNGQSDMVNKILLLSDEAANGLLS